MIKRKTLADSVRQAFFDRMNIFAKKFQAMARKNRKTLDKRADFMIK